MADLTSSPAYGLPPGERGYLSRLELLGGMGDRFGVRLRGWLTPAKTGIYSFWVAADDSAEFWLSSDERPQTKARLCHTPEFTAPREREKRAEQQSKAVSLAAGRRYYAEVLMKQEGGGECLAVGWEGPGIKRQVIGDEYLTPFEEPPAEKRR